MPWHRPADFPVDKLWCRFKGKERDGKPAHMYQIRGITDCKDEWIDLMAESFLRGEPMCQAYGVTEDPAAIAAFQKDWTQPLRHGVSVACFTEVDGQPDQMVGFNILFVSSKDDKDGGKVENEVWRKVSNTLTIARSLVSVFEVYNVDKYLRSSMTVLPEHRGQDIGIKFFQLRKSIAKLLGVEVAASVCTAKASQALAEKCGYTLLAELPYSEMLKRSIDVTKDPIPSAKHMGIRFNFDD